MNNTTMDSRKKRAELISILQKTQEEEGYVSRDSMIRIAEELGIPTSNVYGVATFYNQFRLHKPGKYQIQICRGTACHVKGSGMILETLKNQLGINPGETTRDGLFSLETVACIGACGLAPVIVINGTYYARLTPESIKGILEECRKEDGDAHTAHTME
jgi:NADH-quinone oxidoreductase E subunit